MTCCNGSTDRSFQGALLALAAVCVLSLPLQAFELEIDLRVRSAIDAPPPLATPYGLLQSEVNTAPASEDSSESDATVRTDLAESDQAEQSDVLSASDLTPDTLPEDTLPAEVTDTAEMPMDDPAAEDVAPVDDSASASDATDTRELSVAPGQDPLRSEEDPSWIGAEPDLTSETHVLVVSSMATSRKDQVDDELSMPLEKTLQDYVIHELCDGDDAGDLAGYITSDYIRKNLIDNPEGYIAEIPTSSGPMYQKWVKVHVTPAQRRQMKNWYAQAVQTDRLPPLAFLLSGVLGVVGLSHLVLRRWHPPMTRPVTDDVEVASVRKSRGFFGAMAGLGLLGIGVLTIGATASLFAYRSQTREAYRRAEVEAVRASQAEAQAIREAVTRAVDEAKQASEAPGSEIFAPQPATPPDVSAPTPPDAPVEIMSDAELPKSGVHTTINRNGNQTIIIQKRTR